MSQEADGWEPRQTEKQLYLKGKQLPALGRFLLHPTWNKQQVFSSLDSSKPTVADHSEQRVQIQAPAFTRLEVQLQLGWHKTIPRLIQASPLVSMCSCLHPSLCFKVPSQVRHQELSFSRRHANGTCGFPVTLTQTLSISKAHPEQGTASSRRDQPCVSMSHQNPSPQPPYRAPLGWGKRPRSGILARGV